MDTGGGRRNSRTQPAAAPTHSPGVRGTGGIRGAALVVLAIGGTAVMENGMVIGGAIMVGRKFAAPHDVAGASGRCRESYEMLGLTHAERYLLIAQAAHFRTAARKLADTDPLQDWLSGAVDINVSVERKSAKSE